MVRGSPFIYGKVVSGPHYFPRPEVCDRLVPLILSRQPVLLLGARRCGKSSLLGELAGRLRARHGVAPVLIDLLPVASHLDFLTALRSALQRSRGMPWWRRAADFIRERVPVLRPYLTLEPGGQVGFAVAGRPLDDAEVRSEISACLDLFSRLGKRARPAVFLDEFQELFQLGDGGWLEKTLRTHIQRQAAVAYLYCGSRRSVLKEAFQDRARPFYQQATIVELPPLPGAFAGWLARRFRSGGVRTDVRTARRLLDMVGWNPNAAQVLGHHIVASGAPRLGPGDLEGHLDSLLEFSTNTYASLYDTLAATQKRLLRALAQHPDLSPYSDRVKSACRLSQGNVQAGLQALRRKNLIDLEGRGKGRVRITFDDPLFARWARRFP